MAEFIQLKHGLFTYYYNVIYKYLQFKEPVGDDLDKVFPEIITIPADEPVCAAVFECVDSADHFDSIVDQSKVEEDIVLIQAEDSDEGLEEDFSELLSFPPVAVLDRVPEPLYRTPHSVEDVPDDLLTIEEDCFDELLEEAHVEVENVEPTHLPETPKPEVSLPIAVHVEPSPVPPPDVVFSIAGQGDPQDVSLALAEPKVFDFYEVSEMFFKFRGRKSIRSVDISNMILTNATSILVRVLASHNQIKNVTMKNITREEDADSVLETVFVCLKVQTRMEVLDLSGNILNVRTMPKLKDLLSSSGCNVLQTLILRDTRMTSEAGIDLAAHLHYLHRTKRLLKLQCVVFSGHTLNDEALLKLTEAVLRFPLLHVIW